MLKILLALLFFAAVFVLVRQRERATEKAQNLRSVPLTDPAVTRITDKMAAQIGLQSLEVAMLDDNEIRSLALSDGGVALSRGLVMLKMRGGAFGRRVVCGRGARAWSICAGVL